MKKLIFLCLAACAQGQPIDQCDYTFNPAPELKSSVEKAAARWTAATGCEIHITESGGIPWKVVDYLPRGDGTEAPGATRGNRSEVNIHVRAPNKDRTVLHEMGHAMRGDHVTGMGVLSNNPEWIEVIDSVSLSEVCSANNCLWFVPEGEP